MRPYRHPHLFAVAALLAAGTVAFGPVTADQIVYFLNGKAITVKSVEKGDRFTTLEMEGGGRMGVPNEHIVRIEEYQAPAPAIATPPIQAAAPAAPGGATPAPAAVPAVQAAAQPPPATAAAGPGFGGQPVPPGQGVGSLAPLPLGGDARAQGTPSTPAWSNAPRKAGAGGAAFAAPGGNPGRPVQGGQRRGGRGGLGRGQFARPFPPGADRLQTVGPNTFVPAPLSPEELSGSPAPDEGEPAVEPEGESQPEDGAESPPGS